MPFDQATCLSWLVGGGGVGFWGDLLVSLLSTSSDALVRSFMFRPPTGESKKKDNTIVMIWDIIFCYRCSESSYSSWYNNGTLGVNYWVWVARRVPLHYHSEWVMFHDHMSKSSHIYLKISLGRVGNLIKKIDGCQTFYKQMKYYFNSSVWVSYAGNKLALDPGLQYINI